MTNTMMTLDGALQDLITKTVAAAETAGGFVATEAPIVVEQLLAWNYTISMIWFCLAIIVVVFGTIVGYVLEKTCNEEGVTVFLFAICSIVGFFICCTGNGLTWLQIAIAPKLYLLEYAADLIK